MNYQLYISWLFFLFIGMLALLGKLPWAIPAYYAVLSIATFAVYGHDKAIAGTSARRIPEKTLHAFAAVGGWPGAAIAQIRFRHKTIKESFRIMFWLTVAFNLGLFAYAWNTGFIQRIA